jgi:hypothetical protein
LLFTPVLVIIRRIGGRRKWYVWKDLPGERVLIPEEVCGQVGFKSCCSKDGKMIAVAGNPVIPPHLLSGDLKAVPNGEYTYLMTLRTSFFISEQPFSNFNFLWKNLNTSFAVATAVSPYSPYKLAAIVREYPYELPVSFEEAIRLYKDDENLKENVAKEIKKIFDQGYEENIYLMNTADGKRRKLVTLTEKKWEPHFSGLVNDKAMTWNSAGDKLITHNMESVFTIDLSGNLTTTYELKNCAIFSSLACDANDNISFIVIERGTAGQNMMIYDGPGYLVQIDSSGRELKREKIFTPDTYCFEENNISFVDDRFAASIRFKAADSDRPVLHLGDSVLRVIPRVPKVPQKKPEKYGKEYLFHDPNDVQFYYSIQGYLAETNELLFAKKRLFSSQSATPYTQDNMDAPWVELRRFKLDTTG